MMDVRQDSDSEDDFRLENQGQGRVTTVLREVQVHAQADEPPRKAGRGKARTWTHVISLESHKKFEEWLQNGKELVIAVIASDNCLRVCR